MKLVVMDRKTSGAKAQRDRNKCETNHNALNPGTGHGAIQAVLPNLCLRQQFAAEHRVVKRSQSFARGARAVILHQIIGCDDRHYNARSTNRQAVKT